MKGIVNFFYVSFPNNTMFSNWAEVSYMGRVMDAEGGGWPPGAAEKFPPGAGTWEGGVVENFFTRGVVY